MGFYWIVIDDELLLVVEDFGGGSCIWVRKKLMKVIF